MSLQNTIVAVGGALAPSAVVEATSWTAAFALLTLAPLAAVVVLRPLLCDEHARIAERERRLSLPRLMEASS
jgi:sugar phosphate permease